MILISVVAALSLLSAQSDRVSRMKIRSLLIEGCIIELDSLSLIPSSVFIQDSIFGQINLFSVTNRSVIFSDSICEKLKGRTLNFRYRTFDFDIGKSYSVLDSNMLTFRDILIGGAYEYRPVNPGNRLIESTGMNYKGSFARGLSLGNSQSLVLNSNFDLQLFGDLGNGLKVVAAISDENLPIQAQGNTQQLQEFDKVFIQVSKDRTSVIAGDYELRRPDSYFMNYFKKLKGLSVQTTTNISEKTTVTTSGSFAISRGKFARQILDIREGNQGPYRLQGNNGERFIIVLAGTEKVFFNGILLKRGFDYDYIMDYNRAEISFSPTRVVARDSRVIIEFEYTDITYLRSLYSANAAFSGTKWKANLNMYSEQDSKNATGDIQLDSTDIAILSMSGDDKSRAVRSGIRTVLPEEKSELNRILYRGIRDETIPEGIILVFTENIDSAQYTALFTEVGQGAGNYEIDNTQLRNARVYRYVGEGMGKYRAIIQLIPPEKRQIISLNGSYNPSANTQLFGEIALSNLDINTRSSIDNNDNTGVAAFTSIRHSIKLDTASKWRLNAALKHEFVAANFNALNPYRPPEFIRDWNITQFTERVDENIMSGSLQLTSGKEMNVEYGYNYFDRAGQYTGAKHQLKWLTDTERWKINAVSSFLNSTSAALGERSAFVRPNINMRYLLHKNAGIYIGGEWDAESNIRRSLSDDILLQNSYEYSHIKAIIESDFQKDLAVRLAYSVRTDNFAKEGELINAAEARELELGGKWHSGKTSELSWAITGRELKALAPDLIAGETDRKSILGRVDYGLNLVNGAIRSTTLFNLNSGQEPKIEYIFQRVERGQGDYFLINPSESPNLSNIQDFRYDPSNPLSDYIRLTLFNNEFIRTNNSELNQNLRIEGNRFFKNNASENRSSNIKKWLSALSTLSSVRMNKKRMDNTSTGYGSYFDFNFNDSSLVAYNALINNTLFVNKGNVNYDVQLTQQQVKNRVARVNGFEDRNNAEITLRTRINIKRTADLFLTTTTGRNRYDVEAFAERNLDVAFFRINPELSIRPSQTSRLIFKYIHTDKRQTILTLDKATIRDITLEYSIRKASGYSLDQSFSFVNINFTGAANSPIEYDLLEGLKNGKNFLWNILYTRRLSGNLDLTLNYEGRKTGVLSPVHVGRMQIKATF